MSRCIHVLIPQVAEKIAAGEVIERPASVIKELVENALDAKATHIQVELYDGGKELIVVTDNGIGMSEEDLKLCTLRHATSKIKNFEDLETLVSMGFRGEALPSIAAVSKLSLISRAQNSTQAYSLHLNSEHHPEVKSLSFGEFNYSPHGTQIKVQGLFSEIPVRLKFLKSQSSEVTAVKEWMERLAFTHPEVEFTLYSENKKIFELKAESELERVRSLLCDDPEVKIETSIFEEIQGIRIRIHWLKDLSFSHTRKMIQIINHRAVKDRLIQQALLSAFKQSLLPGQFPALAMYLELPSHLVDVNIHPTKTELRFLNSSQVFRWVQDCASKLIESKYQFQSPAAPLSTAPSEFLTPSISSSLFHQQSSQTSLSFKSSDQNLPAQHPYSSSRFLGILFKTYLVYDLGNEMGLIDQHAAHERIRYEEIKQSLIHSLILESQSLLIPEVVMISYEQSLILKERLTLLTRLGFEVDFFDDKSLVFRGVPSSFGNFDLKTRLLNLVERATAPDTREFSLMDEKLFEKIASEACHSSVRAGDTLHPDKATYLVDSLFKTKHPWNCPHGRPTTFTVSQSQFEEWFKRKLIS